MSLSWLRSGVQSARCWRLKSRRLNHLELEEMKARALAGHYTPHEIVCMIDHKVKVSSPFMEGMPSIGDNKALRAKYDKALHSPQHLENVARQESRERAGIATDRQGQLRIASELKKLSNSIEIGDNDEH